MTIIGIDPGPTQSAVVQVEFDPFRVSLATIGPNEEMRVWLQTRHHEDTAVVACEMLQSYGLAVGRECFETVYWVGRFAECVPAHIRWKRYARPTIKAHVCDGVRRPKDPDVRQALILRFGGTRKGQPLYGVVKDMWAALAVAVACYDGAEEWKL